jgi:hypothetical protein
VVDVDLSGDGLPDPLEYPTTTTTVAEASAMATVGMSSLGRITADPFDELRADHPMFRGATGGSSAGDSG